MVDESAMARILLVDDDPHWLKLVEKSLPEYHVDSAASYDETLDLLRPAVPYDVAIVDLNLIPPGRDELGGSILDKLRGEYPATRRIGLTGLPPGRVRALLERYDLDDLLLKGSMELADVRKTVQLALERTFADVSNDVKTGRWMVLDELRRFRSVSLEQIQARVQSRRTDQSNAERAGMVNEDAVKALQVLGSEKERLEKECSALQGRIASADSTEGVASISAELARLKESFETRIEASDLPR